MAVAKGARIGRNVTIEDGAIVEAGATVGDGCRIDYGVIIRAGVTLGDNSFVGAYSVLGELGYQDIKSGRGNTQPLAIGAGATIRSHSIVYGGTEVGEVFQTGHHATIRENVAIGHHCSVGTFSDIQNNCKLGNYVRLHSNVFLGQECVIKNYAWLFPHVVLTNDKTPPSDHLEGVCVEEFACVCAGAILLPGVKIGRDALVGAGATVTKNVGDGRIVVGSPARDAGQVADICDYTGKPHYPWRYKFNSGMPWEKMGYEAWAAANELNK